jgi:hypothetical protein
MNLAVAAVLSACRQGRGGNDRCIDNRSLPHQQAVFFQHRADVFEQRLAQIVPL